jgi:hypothetical protein
MLAFIASFLTNLFVGLAKSWFGEQDVKKAGAEENQIKVLEANDAKAIEVKQAVDAVVPLTAITVVQHNSGNDSDFRD